jgi:hypothetical protein
VLYVVAWPLLDEADDQVLRRLRTQYHPSEAEMIGPHFTLVFGEGTNGETRLRKELPALADRRAFWFVLDRIERSGRYLYARPSDGCAELTALHEELDPDPGGEPFEPHITLGLFDTPVAAEQVARIVERQRLPLPLYGRVERLALLRREGETLDALLAVRLR